MKILIDLNHPSHFHFFHSFMEKAEKDPSLEMLITTRDRKYIPELLEHYGFNYRIKAGRKLTLWGKALNLPRETWNLIRLARKYKIEAFISFASPYAAIAGFFLQKPVITFDDTENDKLTQLLYNRFSSLILTPECFEKKFPPKQIRFPGTKETSYLAPDLLNPSKEIAGKYLNSPDQPYIIVRFVEHIATHERNQESISIQMKNRFVHELQDYGKVLIISEASVPESLQSYVLEIEPQDIHHLMAFANLFTGESTTMATEAAVLGTPSIVIEEKGRGYIRFLEEQSNMLKWFKPEQEEQALETALENLEKGKISAGTQKPNTNKYSEHTDIGGFLKWLFENFEGRLEELKDHRSLPQQFIYHI